MKPSTASSFLSAVIYYAILSGAPNKISLFVITLVYGFVLFWQYGGIRQAIEALYIIVFPIIIGKTFVIDLITAENLAIQGRPFGISADVTVGIGDVVIMGMAAYMVVHWREMISSAGRIRWMELLLFLYPLGVLVATLYGSTRLDISFLHTVYSFRPLIVYYFFSTRRTLSASTVVSLFAAGICLEVVVVLGQIMRSGPLGISIEPILNYIPVDLSREAAGLLRYSGTYMHANALGNALILPLVLVMPVLLYRYEQRPYIAPYVWVLGVGTLICTMSRSSWGAFASAVIVFCVAIRAVWGYTFHLAYRVPYLTRVILMGAALIVVLGAAPRLISTMSSGGKYGSIETRMLLIKEYGQLISNHPLFGVGLEMDVYTAYLRSFVRGDPDIDSPNRAVLQYFPEPVHNGVLRLLVQVGVVGTAPFVAAVLGGMYLSWTHVLAAKKKNTRFMAMAIFCVYVGVCVNSMMQPILPDLQYLMVLTIMGAHIDA